jgi:hypothetical protein
MNTVTISTEVLELELAKEMSKISKENVNVRLFDNEDLFVFGSELGCLRIANNYKSYETKIGYSQNYKSFYLAIRKFM